MGSTFVPHVMGSQNNLMDARDASSAALWLPLNVRAEPTSTTNRPYDFNLEQGLTIGEGAVSISNATAMTSPDSMSMAAASQAMTDGDSNPRTKSQTPPQNENESTKTDDRVEDVPMEAQSTVGDSSLEAPISEKNDGGMEALESVKSTDSKPEETVDAPQHPTSATRDTITVINDNMLNPGHVQSVPTTTQQVVDWSDAQIAGGIPEINPIIGEGELLAAQNLLHQYQQENAQNLLALQNGGDMSLGMAMQLGLGMDVAIGNSLTHPYLEPSPQIYEEQQDSRVSAYAKLEFDDGQFYMNTYSIVLGRDVQAAKNAQRREREEERARIEAEAEARLPKAPHTPRIKKEGSRYTKSIVSESGGILREGNDSDDEEERRRRKNRRSRKASKKSRSSDSDQQHISRRNSIAQLGGPIGYHAQYQAPAKRAALDHAVPVDPETLKPSPHDCPLVGIHPAAKDGVHAPFSAYKSISRKHVKIAFNSKRHYWEAEILGRNGAFIDDKFCHYEQVICLNSGSVLQIGGVVVRFMLPDIPIGQNGAERPEYEETTSSLRHSIGGKEMSFDFEDDRDVGAEDSSDAEIRQSVEVESGDEADENLQSPNGSREQEEQDEEEDEEEEGGGREENEEEEEEEEEIIYHDLGAEEERQHRLALLQQGQIPDPSLIPQKKRGPGRPPKNGIMSKREQQLARKEALAREKEREGGNPPKASPLQPAVPGKNKVGRPRKHPRPETPPEPREKRKYTKRKPKEPKEGEALKQEGSGGEGAPKEKKEKKPPRPTRSPSPVFNEDELTEQQLAKPQANYVTLIYDALQDSKTGQMSLPQIYRAIQRKYPYFVLKVPTTGWQSSVRHNLSQHHAFQKIERDGKGWMWGIVPGVSIEKEKKKRASPPPQSHPGLLPHGQPYYQGGPPPHIMPYGQQPGMMPPGYPPPYPMPQNYSPGQYPGPHPHQPHHIGHPPHMNGHPPPSGAPHQMHPAGHMNGHPPPPYMPPVAPVMINKTGAYSSPYGPKPTSSNPPNPPPSSQQQQQSRPQQQSTEQKPPVQQQPANIAPQPAPPPPPPPEKGSPSPEDFRTAIQGNSELGAAVERFKTNLIGSLLITKAKDPESIVMSAINRVLGHATETSVPGESEALITKAFKNMLITNMSTLKFTPHRSFASSPPLDQAKAHGSPRSLANQNGTQTNAAQQPSQTTGSSRPTIMRPTFSRPGLNRLSGPSIPRPPMTTPGRTNSGSPATASARPGGPSSVSPAPSSSHISTNGASTLPSAVQEAHSSPSSTHAPGSVHSNAPDNTSGPIHAPAPIHIASVPHAVPMPHNIPFPLPAPTPSPIPSNEMRSSIGIEKEQAPNEHLATEVPETKIISPSAPAAPTTTLPSPPVGQIAGQKRERSHDENELPDLKKINNSDPPTVAA